MTQPLVSIIIPVWNRASEALDCLVSLEKQTYRSFEVIMVDDGSTDGLSDRLSGKTYQFSFTFFRLEKNSGSPVAPRNYGFEHSNGPFIFFLDADIVLVPHAIERFVRALEENQDVSFVYSAHYFGWKLFRCRPFDEYELRRCNYIHTSSLIRREAFPGFDPELKRFQDWDIWLTIVERGGKGYWISEPLFRIKPGGTISTWIPSFIHRMPWHWIGWMPKELRRYRAADAIIRTKHQLK